MLRDSDKGDALRAVAVHQAMQHAIVHDLRRADVATTDTELTDAGQDAFALLVPSAEQTLQAYGKFNFFVVAPLDYKAPTQYVHGLPSGRVVGAAYNETVDILNLERVRAVTPSLVSPASSQVRNEDAAGATSRAWASTRGRRGTLLVPSAAWTTLRGRAMPQKPTGLQ